MLHEQMLMHPLNASKGEGPEVLEAYAEIAGAFTVLHVCLQLISITLAELQSARQPSC